MFGVKVLLVEFRSGTVWFCIVLSGLMGVGCSHPQPDPTSPLEETPGSFAQTGSDTVPGRWWQAFGDTQLNRKIDHALDDNFDLKTAWSRLRAARATLDRESASLFPSLDGSAGASVRNDGVGSNPSSEEIARLGLSAEYEVDLWGRIDSQVEAEQFRTRATRFDLRTAGISLASEVTRTWYQLVEQHRQLDLLNDQIETNRQILNLIRRQFGTGQIQRADLLRQEQLLESTREQKISVESNIEVLEHQLASLMGQSPQNNLDYRTPGELPELPPLPQTGLPAELIRRRPDVRSAFNQLKAADRELAVAVTNQYPRLSLTASLSSSNEGASELFDDWARSFAADLTAPLLDAGQRDAEVERTEAVRQQRLYEYGQAILTAFREVEDALVEEQKQRERIQNLEKQLSLAEDTVDRVRSQYFNGQGDYIDVLSALNEEQQLRRDSLSVRLRRLESRVSLYRALAGGFEMEPALEAPPGPASSDKN